MKQEDTMHNSSYFTVAPGLWGRRDVFVNMYFIQNNESGEWALVDAGLKWSAKKIRAIAKKLFGDNPPQAIFLTHGHFDHVGALPELLRSWDVPVYAHELEFPYLTGQSEYPPADPSVGGGIMSALSFLYPTVPSNFTGRLKKLMENQSIPGFPEWKCIATPGHSPGHVSFFRESDRILLAGDAFVTTKAESGLCTLVQKKVISGPPKYFTCNWASAKFSVLKLEALNPNVVATGHGRPMEGPEMRQELGVLSRHFEQLAVPETGRYVNEPAVTNSLGVVSIPKRMETIPTALIVAGTAAIFASAFVIYRTRKAG
jgi:glyoxylase-like metal-dependent hydrolase (beta-lactamase superfamily II)